MAKFYDCSVLPELMFQQHSLLSGNMKTRMLSEKMRGVVHIAVAPRGSSALESWQQSGGRFKGIQYRSGEGQGWEMCVKGRISVSITYARFYSQFSTHLTSFSHTCSKMAGVYPRRTIGNWASSWGVSKKYLLQVFWLAPHYHITTAYINEVACCNMIGLGIKSYSFWNLGPCCTHLVEEQISWQTLR